MMRLTRFDSQAVTNVIALLTHAPRALAFFIEEKSIDKALASLLTVVLMSTISFGATYSNSFEYDDWNAAVDDGWAYVSANQPTIDFVTSTVTANTPTDGLKAMQLASPFNGSIRKTIFDADVEGYVISYDWYVLNPNSTEAAGMGSRGYNSYFQLGSADGSSAIRFVAHHFGTTREIEPGVSQLNARALSIRYNGGPSDHASYLGNNDVIEARYFQDGWNTLQIHASTHPELGGDWLRYYLNDAFVGESTVNWFGWDASFSTINFGWTSLGANTGYVDNLSVTTPSAGFEADFDQDNDVDGEDFLTWQRGLGSAGGLSQGDANDDGMIDGLDLDAWKAQFRSTPASSTIASVPEPSTLALVVSSVCLAGARLARARSKRAPRA